MYSRAYFPPPVAHSRLVQQTCDRLTGVINSKQQNISFSIRSLWYTEWIVVSLGWSEAEDDLWKHCMNEMNLWDFRNMLIFVDRVKKVCSNLFGRQTKTSYKIFDVYRPTKFDWLSEVGVWLLMFLSPLDFPVVLPRSEQLLQVREMLLLTILWT